MAATPPHPSSPPRSLAEDLPDELLAEIASRLFPEDIAWFWILSRVCRAFKRAAEEAAGRATRLGGDAASVALRRRGPLEPAVPLGRLLRHSPRLTTLDLSGAYWWVNAEAAAAVGASPCARRLEALRLDNCEQIEDGGQADHRGLAAMVGGGAVELADLELHVAAPAGLRVLDATGVESANDAMCGRLAAAGRVEELRLAMTHVSDAGLALLADAAAFPALRRVELALRSQNVWPDGAHTAAGLDALRRRRPDAVVALVSV